MNTQATKKKILALLDSFDWLFSIQNYSKILEISKEESAENERMAARVIYEEEYNQITITIYPIFFEGTKEEQRKTLLHELCHTITIPSKKLAHSLLEGKLVTPEEIKFINERSTSQIENILDRLLQGKLKYAQDAYKKYLK